MTTVKIVLVALRILFISGTSDHKFHLVCLFMFSIFILNWFYKGLKGLASTQGSLKHVLPLVETTFPEIRAALVSWQQQLPSDFNCGCSHLKREALVDPTWTVPRNVGPMQMVGAGIWVVLCSVIKKSKKSTGVKSYTGILNRTGDYCALES